MRKARKYENEIYDQIKNILLKLKTLTVEEIMLFDFAAMDWNIDDWEYNDIQGKPVFRSIQETTMENVNGKMERLGSEYRIISDKDCYSEFEKACWYYLSGCKTNWKNKFGIKTVEYDYDVSLTSMLIYKLLFKYLPMEMVIERYHFNIFQMVQGDLVYRGDTMNSFNTPVIEFIRRYGDKKGKPLVCIINQTLRSIHKGKFMVSNRKNYLRWYDFILDNIDYFRKQLPVEIETYSKWNHKIGNYLPVPFKAGNGKINSSRGMSATKDYWDLALNAIYKWYKEKDECAICRLVGKMNLEFCKRWLDNFVDKEGKPSWKIFIMQNFLEDFVEDNYGKPTPLWKEHFNRGVEPKTKNEFIEFFSEASKRIERRSRKMAEALHQMLQEWNDEELERQIKKMIKLHE